MSVYNSWYMSNGTEGSARTEKETEKLEKKSPEELKEVVADRNKKDRLLQQLEHKIETLKTEAKSKIVGGQEKHKRELDKIVNEGKRELQRIESLQGERKKKALKELEQRQQRQIDRLVKEIGEEAGKLGDKKTENMVKNERIAEQVWQGLVEMEQLQQQLKKEMDSRRPDLRNLSRRYNQLVERETEVSELMEKWDYKGPLQIRNYWETEIKTKIDNQMVEGGKTTREMDKLKAGVKEIMARQKGGRKASLSAGELAETIQKLEESKKSGELSNEESEWVRKSILELSKIYAQTKQRELKEPKQILKQRVEERESLREGELAKVRRLVTEGKMTGKQAENLVRDLKGLTDRDRQLLKAMDEGEEVLLDLVRGTETKRIVELVNTLETNMGQAYGEFDSTKRWRQYQEATISPIGLEAQRAEAIREAITVAMERFKEKGGRNAVTEEDIRNWAFGKVEEMIRSGDEATGYSARQLIGQVSSVFAATEIDFDKELKASAGPRGESLIHDADLVLTGKHDSVISDETKDLIEGMMAVTQFSHVYNSSQNAEDLVRAAAGLEMWHVGKTLEARGQERKVEGRVGFYAVELDTMENLERGYEEDKQEIIESGLSEKKRNKRLKDLDKEYVKKRENVTGHKVRMADKAEIGWFGENGKGKEERLEFDKSRDKHLTDIYEKTAKANVELVIKSGERAGQRISMEELDKMLPVDAVVQVRVAELMNLMHQERFASQLMNVDGKVKDRARQELVREVIKIEMGLVDIDGIVELDKLQELVGGEFEFQMNGRVVDKNQYKIRAHLAVTGLDEKGINWDKGIREKDFVEVENKFRWAHKLAEGIWRFSGTGTGSWDKHHRGNSEDWNRKILHLVPYLTKFGIGTALLRETCHTDFVDIFSRRKGELIVDKMKEKIEFYERDGSIKDDDELDENEKAAKELLGRMLTDRNGFLMARSKLVDMFEHYEYLNNKDRGGANQWLRGRLIRLASFDGGEKKAQIKVNKAMKVLAEGEFGFEDKATGFEGYLKMIRKEYKFENFNWDHTWDERIIKEYQYQLYADKFRIQLMGWAANPEDNKKMIEAVRTPGYYGQADYSRKYMMMFRELKKYFSRNLGGVEYPDVELPGYNNVDYDKQQDLWDGVLHYKKTRKWPGFFPAKERGAEPFLPRHFENRIKEAQYAQVFVDPEEVFEMKNEIAVPGFMKKIDVAIEKTPKGAREVLKLIRGVLMGGVLLKDSPWGAISFEGILAWVLRKLKDLAGDIWKHKWDIFEGTASEVGKGMTEDLK